MAIRFYSSTAIQTTLTAGITPSNTTIVVAATTGFPGSTPYTLSLDYGGANEELVDVTAVAGFSLTVTRSVDSTPASSHNVGAVVRHVTSARDFTEFQQHINGSTNVHGLAVGSAVVGTTDTQTLTNKTLTKAHGSLENVDLFNTGPGAVTSVIGDSANLTASRMNWLRDEVSLTPMITFNSSGGAVLAKSVTDTDATYKVRVVEDVGGTDRAALLAGGTLALTPTSTTAFLPLDIGVPDTSATKRAIRLADSGGANERLAVFNDGHTTISNLSPAQIAFRVRGAVAQSANFLNVQDSASKSLILVNSAGRFIAAESSDIGNVTGTAATVPLRVFANTTSQTGNLQQWINSSNAIVASVAANGSFDTVGNLSVTSDIEVNGSIVQTSQGFMEYRATQTGTGSVSVTAATSQSVIVTFATPFNSVPSVHVNIASGAGTTSGWNCRAIGLSTTGFTAFFYGASTTFAGIPFNWTAVSTN